MFIILLYSILNTEIENKNNSWSNLDQNFLEDTTKVESKFIILTLETVEDLDDKKLELSD